MKKSIALILVCTLALFLFAACDDGSSEAPAYGNPSQDTPAQDTPAQDAPAQDTSNFDNRREIIVVSRESGSGTRGAFVELTGVEVSADGNTTDMTSPEAVIGNNTNAIMTNVSGDLYAIGYISTGSIDNSIKAVNIDGVEPTPANILAGNYKIARPFIVVTMDGLSPVAQDFLSFIMSQEGQEIVADRYIPVDQSAPAFESNRATGTVVVGGSTSVSPVVERLAEAYQEINTGANIEVHATGSGAGITGAIDGVVDIGMSSRNIRDSEMENLYQQITIAMDGIAVIVNNDNPLTNLTMEEVREIFTGEKTRWSDVH
ncbi:MAG: substrate-binding domain-containing protein [Oscillospiraceae bacterium]|nr:substrate-binding domain-containing protein [Oscillospiraceae bacterium]